MGISSILFEKSQIRAVGKGIPIFLLPIHTASVAQMMADSSCDDWRHCMFFFRKLPETTCVLVIFPLKTLSTAVGLQGRNGLFAFKYKTNIAPIGEKVKLC